MSAKVFGIDFGTSTIKIYRKNEGVIFDEKNIIALCNNEVMAIGDEAFEMLGKAPDNFFVTYPVRNGVIADIANMLALLNKAFKVIIEKSGKISGADIIVATPTDVTEVEKRAFFDLAASSIAKPKKVRVVEKPVADAIGSGLDVMDARGVMVVNIGADTTEISIMSLGGIVLSKLVTTGGNLTSEFSSARNLENCHSHTVFYNVKLIIFAGISKFCGHKTTTFAFFALIFSKIFAKTKNFTTFAPQMAS